MTMIDPESLMFSLPRFKLPFDYCKTLHATEEQKAQAEKMQRMTDMLMQSYKEAIEKATYKACFAPTTWREKWKGGWRD